MRDPNAALTGAGLSLSARDMKKLTTLVGSAARSPARDGHFVVPVNPATALKLMARRRLSSDESWPSPFWPMMWQALRFSGPALPVELELRELAAGEKPIPGIH
jgi:hypothetical protein